MTNTDTSTPQHFWVFVYGSLRKGLHNYPMTRGSIKGEPRAGLITPFRLYSNYGGSYPYLAKGLPDDPGGAVHGELMLMEWNAVLHRIIDMETGAGYTTELVDVTVQGKDEPIKAIAFVHDERFKNHRGERVIGGDWKVYFDNNEETERRLRAARYAGLSRARDARGRDSYFGRSGTSEKTAKKLLDAEGPLQKLPARR